MTHKRTDKPVMISAEAHQKLKLAAVIGKTTIKALIGKFALSLKYGSR